MSAISAPPFMYPAAGRPPAEAQHCGTPCSPPGHLLRLSAIGAMIVGVVGSALQTDSSHPVP